MGFISDLPTELVAAFRATLEEVLEADLILHVRDISHPESQEQKADVEDILNDLGLPDSVPVLEVWNKIDRLDEETRNALLNKADREEVFAISAVTGQGLAPLLQAIETGLEEDHLTEVLNLGFEEGRRRAWLFEQGVVTEDAQGDEGYRMVVRWTAKQAARFRGL